MRACFPLKGYGLVILSGNWAWFTALQLELDFQVKNAQAFRPPILLLGQFTCCHKALPMQRVGVDNEFNSGEGVRSVLLHSPTIKVSSASQFNNPTTHEGGM